MAKQVIVTQHNEFRAVDAFEFVSAFQGANQMTDEAIKTRLKALNEQIHTLEEKGADVPSYLLAAYRGYEYAQIMRSKGLLSKVPYIVKLIDNVDLNNV